MKICFLWLLSEQATHLTDRAKEQHRSAAANPARPDPDPPCSFQNKQDEMLFVSLCAPSRVILPAGAVLGNVTHLWLPEHSQWKQQEEKTKQKPNKQKHVLCCPEKSVPPPRRCSAELVTAASGWTHCTSSFSTYHRKKPVVCEDEAGVTSSTVSCSPGGAAAAALKPQPGQLQKTKSFHPALGGCFVCHRGNIQLPAAEQTSHPPCLTMGTSQECENCSGGSQKPLPCKLHRFAQSRHQAVPGAASSPLLPRSLLSPLRPHTQRQEHTLRVTRPRPRCSSRGTGTTGVLQQPPPRHSLNPPAADEP